MGVACGERRVGRLMREARVRGLQHKRHRSAPKDVVTTIAGNILDQKFTVSQPNKVWVADLTYLHTTQGWLYLAVILDLFSRMVVGWAMSTVPDSRLTLDALRMALGRRRPGHGLLHHSDRGVQYTAAAYQSALKANGIVPSISRKAHCWDNAVAESFFNTLKLELYRDGQFVSRAAARTAVFDFIEVWYNRQRRHSTLGYVSPEAFEARVA
jgi:transposase InsO family protein